VFDLPSFLAIFFFVILSRTGRDNEGIY
jgi:hypothetical protein